MPHSASLHNKIQLLEQVFTDIYQQRMRDLPFINVALQVEAVAFQEWEQDCLGILITPWFMNLLRLPTDDTTTYRSGDKVIYHLPSGDYEFIVGREERLGTYYSCSLLSPVFEFTDQTVAHATAIAVMEQLLALPAPAAPTTDLTTCWEKTVSRRDLLRGHLPTPPKKA